MGQEDIFINNLKNNNVQLISLHQQLNILEPKLCVQTAMQI